MTEKLLTVIHNSEASFLRNEEEITAAAAAAADSSSLIAELQKYFPKHNVAEEFDYYLKYRTRVRPTRKGFAKWMLRAEVPLKKPPKPVALAVLPGLAKELDAPNHPDLFDELEHRRFVEQYTARKTQQNYRKETQL